MIYSVSGKLLIKNEDSVVVETQGIGYLILVPASMMSKLPSTGDTVTLFTYHHIREDAQSLFGFMTEEERHFFIRLTGVSGVGPKVGLKILSTLTPAQFVSAVLSTDLRLLTSVPGIGKKVAERLVLELKDKVSEMGLGHSETIGEKPTIQAIPKANDDLFEALKSLGYHPDEIKKAYLKAAITLSDEMSVEASVKVLLKYL